MPASLYSGDYARVSPKSMTLFPLPLIGTAFLARQKAMTCSIIRAPDVRRNEAA
jgi:hypothetical protein